MSSKISMILDLLGDGEWHGIAELERKSKLANHNLGEILSFLDKYGLAKVDVENRKVKINKAFQKLLELTTT